VANDIELDDGDRGERSPKGGVLTNSDTHERTSKLWYIYYRESFISFIIPNHFNPSYTKFFSPTARQPLVGHGLLTVEASRTQSDTPHSVGLLWTSDQPDADTSTWHTTLTGDRRPCPPGGFEPTIPATERPLESAYLTYTTDKLLTTKNRTVQITKLVT
jgi:hypothetical protein